MTFHFDPGEPITKELPVLSVGKLTVAWKPALNKSVKQVYVHVGVPFKRIYLKFFYPGTRTSDENV